MSRIQQFSATLAKWRGRPERPGYRSGLIGAILSAFVGLALLLPNNALLNGSHDIPFWFKKAVAPGDIKIIAMDEASGAGHTPWNRTRHAELLDWLKTEGVRAVIFDVFFRDPNPTNDTKLIDSMQRHGLIVVGSHLQQIQDSAVDLNYELQTPYPAILQAASTNGILEVKGSATETVRRFWPGRADLNAKYTSLTWAAATSLDPELSRIGPHPPRGWLLNYYGPPRTFTVVSYLNATNRPPGFFRNSIVIVGNMLGTGLEGQSDKFRSPYPRSSYYSDVFDGAEIHATMLGNLLRREWVREPNPNLTFIGILLLGSIVGWGLTRCKPVSATILAAVAALLISLVGILAALELRIWLPWLIGAAVQIPVALAWAILADSVRAYGDNQALRRSLSGYLSPNVVAHVLRDPASLHPGGRKQSISILASDLASFSRISERMDATSVMGMLNQYYTQAVCYVHQSEGTVLNLVGDGMFAIWNAPLAQPDHPARAVRAALELQYWAAQFSANIGNAPLRVRIGLNTGEACVGNVGGTDYFNFTAIGREVNLTSRLEGLNKFTGTGILCTRAVAELVGSEFTLRSIGWFRLAGIDQTVEVHEILGDARLESETRQWRTLFAEGIHHFQRASSDPNEFVKAAAAFERTLAIHPGDGPSIFYLASIERFRRTGLPSGWLGEIDVTEK